MNLFWRCWVIIGLTLVAQLPEAPGFGLAVVAVFLGLLPLQHPPILSEDEAIAEDLRKQLKG